ALGCGHTVTAFYEVIPPGQKVPVPGVDPRKYQEAPKLTDAAASGEMLTVKLRYQEPEGDTSKPLSVAVKDEGKRLEQAPMDFRFAAAVAEFGLLLRQSQYRGDATFADTLELARGAKGPDPHGHRTEFLTLVETAQRLTRGEADRR